MFRIIIYCYALVLLLLSGCAVGIAALYGAVSGTSTYYIEREFLVPPCAPGSYRVKELCVWEKDFESPSKNQKIERDKEVTALAKV